MRVFLTGGHGFIGSRVSRQLIARGHEITCLVRETSRTHRIDDIPHAKIVGDVRETSSFEHAMKGMDAVIHLASVSSWHELRSDALESTIIDGTSNVLGAARRSCVRRAVYVSSILAINASKTPRIFDEDSPFELQDSSLRYSLAKRRAEESAMAIAADGFDVVIVNPGEVYGPDDDTFVTAGNLKDILSSWPALACSGGTPVTHVDDVADGIILAMEKGRSRERYILGGDNLSIEEVVRSTLEIAGKRAPVLKLPNGLVKAAIQTMAKLGLPTPAVPEVLDYATLYWFMDSSKAIRELGYRPRPAREALGAAIAWLYEAGHVKPRSPGTFSSASGRV